FLRREPFDHLRLQLLINSDQREVESDFSIRFVRVAFRAPEGKIHDVSAGDDVALGDQEAASDNLIGQIEDANDGWFKLLAHPALMILLSRLIPSIFTVWLF